MKLAVDVMGGDNAPQAVLDGVLAFFNEPEAEGVDLKLFGNEDVLKAFQAAHPEISNRIEAVYTTETIGMGEHPTEAIRKKKDSVRGRAARPDRSVFRQFLSDIVLNSTLDPEQMDREKGVVLEEIAMTEDSPEDIVFDRASEQLFAGTPIESEILGTERRDRSNEAVQ